MLNSKANEINRLNNHIKIIEHENNALKAKNSYLEAKASDIKKYFLSEMSREFRIHPYIVEGLSIVVNKKNLIDLNYVDKLAPSKKLSELFLINNSDKNTIHSYADFYEHVIYKNNYLKILEVGIGSQGNFMYANGNYGGSLKAWREYLNGGIVIGADIDKKAIEAVDQPAFWVDQSNRQSLSRLKDSCKIYGDIDLIIDDGFHDLHTNLNTLLELLELLSKNGLYVIEDVHESLLDLWAIISHYLNLNLSILNMKHLRPDINDNNLLLFVRKDFGIL